MSEERKSTKRISEVNFCKSEHISPSVTTFSSEQRAILRSMNFNYICKLTGQSIASLRDEGNTFSYKWHIGEAFEDEHSTLTEVAINTNSFWIIDSDRKTFAEQTAIILSYSKKINEIVPGVEAKLGKAADYAELFFTHRKIVGDILFGPNHDYISTRTTTHSSNAHFVIVGPAYGDEISICYYNDENRDNKVFVVPLLVPAPIR